MEKITYLITVLMLLFVSCAGNDFSFDEEKQTFKAHSTYFGKIEINGIDNDDCFIIKRKNNGKKLYSINLNKIPESYYVQKDYDGDTIKDFKLKRNNNYEIINRGVYDAASLKIVVYIDENGLIKKVKDSVSGR